MSGTLKRYISATHSPSKGNRAGPYTDQEKRRKSDNTSDADDREQEGICGQSGLPQT